MWTRTARAVVCASASSRRGEGMMHSGIGFIGRLISSRISRQTISKDIGANLLTSPMAEKPRTGRQACNQRCLPHDQDSRTKPTLRRTGCSKTLSAWKASRSWWRTRAPGSGEGSPCSWPGRAPMSPSASTAARRGPGRWLKRLRVWAAARSPSRFLVLYR